MDNKQEQTNKEKSKIVKSPLFWISGISGFAFGLILTLYVGNFFVPDIISSAFFVIEMAIKNTTGISFDIVGRAVADKPILYLYTDVDDREVNVGIDTSEEITVTYPKAINNSWNVKADKDGTIRDEDGLEYNYLFWESKYDEIEWDFSQGFCVKGSESAEFLDKALSEIGLNRKEANEFIVYWLPKLEANEWNLISFQTKVYEDTYKLKINPVPDNVLRVFMTYKGVDIPVDIKEQDLKELGKEFKREGFHVVEWGGSEVH